jgi:hypothetical protein
MRPPTSTTTTKGHPAGSHKPNSTAAQAKAPHPDWADRFFNVNFIVNPQDEVILRHYKVSPLFPAKHSVCPHDVYDRWIAQYGRALDEARRVLGTGHRASDSPDAQARHLGETGALVDFL